MKDIFNTEKIERFAAAFSKYNHSEKMAILFNEMMEDVEMIMEYAFEKEMESDKLAKKYTDWIKFQIKYYKIKNMAERMKKQIHYASKN